MDEERVLQTEESVVDGILFQIGLAGLMTWPWVVAIIVLKGCW